MKSHIFSLCLLIAPVYAIIETTSANGTCRTVSAPGQQQICFWTDLYRPPLAVNTYSDLCGASPNLNVSDTGLSSICNANESFTTNSSTYKEVVTNEPCTTEARGQYWQYYDYTWQCCLCPPGWVTVNAPPLYCGADEPCVRCSGPDEELVFVPVGPNNMRLIQCITTTASSTRTSTSTTSSTKSPPTTCGESSKRDLLTGRAISGGACTSCLDLTILSEPFLAGSQMVINVDFVNDVNAIVQCAKKNGFTQLIDVSSSRCFKSKGSFAGSLPSPHLIGMAMDVNLRINAKTVCNRQCFLEAYCVHNLNFNLCKPVLSTFTRRKPNAVDTMVYNFITCVGDAGLVVGAKIRIAMKKKNKSDPTIYEGDWDHFQGIPTGPYDISLYNTYHPQLVQFCKGECANAPKKNPSTEACPVAPDPTCS